MVWLQLNIKRYWKKTHLALRTSRVVCLGFFLIIFVFLSDFVWNYRSSPDYLLPTPRQIKKEDKSLL